MEIGMNSLPGEEKSISFNVQTTQPEKMVVRVRDAYKPSTYYIDRIDTIKPGKGETYYLRMPQCPAVGVIEIYNEKNGQLKSDPSFKMTGLKSKPLNKALDVYSSRN